MQLQGTMEEEKREMEERGRRERWQRRRRIETASIYVGEVKDGERHGKGTLTLPDGEKYEGEFREGRQWNVTFTDLDGSKTEWKDGYEIDDE